MMNLPLYRSIVALDIESSATRPNPVKSELRNKAFELFEAALRAAGVDQRYRDQFIDRGDGILALVHPVDQAAQAGLLNRAVPSLAQLLAEYNTGLPQRGRLQRQLRIRVVVHAGEVHYDDKGCYGEALDVAFRLLDAAPVKRALRETAEPLVLVISGDIHRSVVRHSYDGIDEQSFQQLVRVHVGGRRCQGWVRIPVTKPAAGRWKHQDLTRIPIPGAALSAVYMAIERHLAGTEEPYDVEAGLATLKEWMSAGQARL